MFREIDPPRRLQRTEVFEAMPGSESLVTLSLQSGMELGVKECFQKIDELLATL